MSSPEEQYILLSEELKTGWSAALAKDIGEKLASQLDSLRLGLCVVGKSPVDVLSRRDEFKKLLSPTFKRFSLSEGEKVSFSSDQDEQLIVRQRISILIDYFRLLYVPCLHSDQGEKYLLEQIKKDLEFVSSEGLSDVVPFEELYFDPVGRRTNFSSLFALTNSANISLRVADRKLDWEGLPAEAVAYYELVHNVSGVASAALFRMKQGLVRMIIQGSTQDGGRSCLANNELFQVELSAVEDLRKLAMPDDKPTINGVDAQLVDLLEAEFFLLCGKYDEALPLFQQWPGERGGVFHVQIARCLNGLGRHEEAFAAARTFILGEFHEAEFEVIFMQFFACRKMFKEFEVDVPDVFAQVETALKIEGIPDRYTALGNANDAFAILEKPDDNAIKRLFELLQIRLSPIINYLHRHNDCPEVVQSVVSLDCSDDAIQEEIQAPDSLALVNYGNAFRELAVACFEREELGAAEDYIQKSIVFLQHVGNARSLAGSYRVAGDIRHFLDKNYAEVDQFGSYASKARHFYYLALEYLETAYSPSPDRSQRVRLVDNLKDGKLSLDFKELLESLQIFLGRVEEIDVEKLEALELDRDFYLFLFSPDFTSRAVEGSVRDTVLRTLKGAGAAFVGILQDGKFHNSDIPANLHDGEGVLYEGPSTYADAARTHLSHTSIGNVTTADGPIILAHPLGLESNLSRLAYAAFGPITQLVKDHSGNLLGIIADAPPAFAGQVSRLLSVCMDILKQEGIEDDPAEIRRLVEVVETVRRVAKIRDYLRTKLELRESSPNHTQTVDFLVQQAIVYPDPLVRTEIHIYLLEHKHLPYIKKYIDRLSQDCRAQGRALNAEEQSRLASLHRAIHLDNDDWDEQTMRMYEGEQGFDPLAHQDSYPGTPFDRALLATLRRAIAEEQGIDLDRVSSIEVGAGNGRLAFSDFENRAILRLKKLGQISNKLLSLYQKWKSPEYTLRGTLEKQMDVAYEKDRQAFDKILSDIGLFASDYSEDFVKSLRKLLEDHPLWKRVLVMNPNCIATGDMKKTQSAPANRVHLRFTAMHSTGHNADAEQWSQFNQSTSEDLRPGGYSLEDSSPMRFPKRDGSLTKLGAYDYSHYMAIFVHHLRRSATGVSDDLLSIGPPGSFLQDDTETIVHRDATGGNDVIYDRTFLEPSGLVSHAAAMRRAAINWQERGDLQASFLEELKALLESTYADRDLEADDIVRFTENGVLVNFGPFYQEKLDQDPDADLRNRRFAPHWMQENGIISEYSEEKPSGFWKNVLYPLMVLGIDYATWQRYYSCTVEGRRLNFDEVLAQYRERCRGDENELAALDAIAREGVFDFEAWAAEKGQDPDEVISSMKNDYKTSLESASRFENFYFVTQKLPEDTT